MAHERDHPPTGETLHRGAELIVVTGLKGNATIDRCAAGDRAYQAGLTLGETALRHGDDDLVVDGRARSHAIVDVERIVAVERRVELDQSRGDRLPPSSAASAA